MLRAKLLILLFLSVAIYSCGDSIFAPSPFYDVIYDRPGLIDSLGGDCSGVEVRNKSLGEFDLTLYDSLRFEFNNSTDTDLSAFEIFYLDEDEHRVPLVYIENLSISAITQWTIVSPNVRKELWLRLRLYSSKCTGQIYHLTSRDLKIKAK